MSTKLLASLFEHKAWANQEMFAALRKVPADANRRDMAVILFTLDHLSITDQIFKANISGQSHLFEAVVARAMPNLDELAETVRATDAWYVDYVKSASEAELGESVAFTFVADGMAGRMTREEMLGHVLTHGASHRGAVGKMLEIMQVQGPPDMFTTFVHRQPA
ncbi:MAG TPA: DinB family protein [Caulobacteraceae bacterium]|nr:DinB family protein [Caulobacteraceae bacterium]